MDNEYKNQDEEQENSLETSNQAELNDEKADEGSKRVGYRNAIPSFDL